MLMGYESMVKKANTLQQTTKLVNISSTCLSHVIHFMQNVGKFSLVVVTHCDKQVLEYNMDNLTCFHMSKTMKTDSQPFM